MSGAIRESVQRVERASQGAATSSYYSTGSRAYVSRDGHTTFMEVYPRGPAKFNSKTRTKQLLAAARAGELAEPTLGDQETWRDVAGFTPDVEALAARGMAFERLDQLALEHLYGVR